MRSPACLPSRASRRLPSGGRPALGAAAQAREVGGLTASSTCAALRPRCWFGSARVPSAARRPRRARSGSSASSSAASPTSLRIQCQRVVVVVVRNADERERLVGAAQRHAELVDGGPTVVFAKPREVRVAIGPRLSSRSSNAIEAHRGADHVMTTPAAAKAPTCARSLGQLTTVP